MMSQDPPHRPHDIFDPFDHDGDATPNLIRTDSARMLSTNPSGMVDPDHARTVAPEQANVIDPNDATQVIAERADAAVDHDELASSDTLVLIGAPGSGKSTIGPLLAERLGLAFCDVDARIEERVGKPVGEIFADDGESAFRRLEEAATLDAVEQTGLVVSLGGGAVMSPRIRVALTDHPVVWLEVTAATAINRAGLNTARPLLVGNVRGTLMKLLAERTPVYEALATITVSNDGDDPGETVDQIVGALGELAGPGRGDDAG